MGAGGGLYPVATAAYALGELFAHREAAATAARGVRAPLAPQLIFHCHLLAHGEIAPTVARRTAFVPDEIAKKEGLILSAPAEPRSCAESGARGAPARRGESRWSPRPGSTSILPPYPPPKRPDGEIVEVLSYSHDYSDRTEKFAAYRRLKSLPAYVPGLAAGRCREVCRRECRLWYLDEYGPGARLTLDSLALGSWSTKIYVICRAIVVAASRFRPPI